MAREARAEWRARIARWQASGLTAVRCAAREVINPRTLAFREWKLRREEHTQSAQGRNGIAPAYGRVAFLEVLRAAAPAPAFEVPPRTGYRVSVAAGFDGDTLRALLDVLAARR